MTTMTSSAGNGSDARRDHVRRAVKNACDQLNSDGVEPRNYVEQLSWLFFLKAFEASEDRRAEEAAFEDVIYSRRLDGRYRWSVWTRALTGKPGAHDGLKTPEQVFRFVNADLFEKLTTLGDDTLGLQFQRIFTTVRNHSRRPGSFARVVAQAERIDFSQQADVIELSEIYERLLKDVAGDSAGYAGEFYTQRHIVRAMVEVVQPSLGDTVYDPCMGTAGFLFESAEYVRRHHPNMSGDEFERFQKDTFVGTELKPLSYLLGIMNMILHGIDQAKLALADTLERHENNVAETRRRTVILSNPPYGGKMDRDSQGNFTIQSAATEILFLQHIMANLARSGRAGVIVPEGVLFRDGPDARVREKLLNNFRLHTILSLPAGCFLPYTPVKTYVLFFDREKTEQHTDSVYYFECTNDGFTLNSSRTPIPGSQLRQFLDSWRERKPSTRSWIVTYDDIKQNNWTLRVPNPNLGADYSFPPIRTVMDVLHSRAEEQLRLSTDLEQALSAVESNQFPQAIPASTKPGNSWSLNTLKRAIVLGENRDSRQWTKVDSVVDWDQSTEPVSDDETYGFMGVRSFGRGPFNSASRKGSEFKYPTLRKLQLRQFVYPKLMAWEGAFAMVPPEFAGKYVSPEFVVFTAREAVLLPEVLDTYFRSPVCLPEVRGASRGSNKRRRRLRPQEFLSLEVPQPDMHLQLLLRRVYEYEWSLQNLTVAISK